MLEALEVERQTGAFDLLEKERNLHAIKRWTEFCRKHPLLVCREYVVEVTPVISTHRTSNIFCDNWKEIAADMKLSARSIHRLESRLTMKYNKKSKRRIVKYLLIEWVSVMSTDATIGELLRILEKNDLLDMASKYKQLNISLKI